MRQVLAGVAAHYPRHADREELAQAAALGLVEAACRYDGAREVPFGRWASVRIRGAIVDAVRALDFAPRTLRSAARQAEATRARLEADLGRPATTAETAAALGIPESELAALQGRVHQSLVLSLDAPVGSSADGEPTTLGASILDEAALQPFEVLEQREQRTYLRDALECLPDRMRDVVQGYFIEGRSSAPSSPPSSASPSRGSRRCGPPRSRSCAPASRRSTPTPPALARAPAQPVPPQVAARQSAYASAVAGRSTYAGRLTSPGRRPSAPPSDAGPGARRPPGDRCPDTRVSRAPIAGWPGPDSEPGGSARDRIRAAGRRTDWAAPA